MIEPEHGYQRVRAKVPSGELVVVVSVAKEFGFAGREAPKLVTDELVVAQLGVYISGGMSMYRETF